MTCSALKMQSPTGRRMASSFVLTLSLVLIFLLGIAAPSRAKEPPEQLRLQSLATDSVAEGLVDPEYSASTNDQPAQVGQKLASNVKGPPSLPSSYWGKVTVNGNAVTPGTVVTAWVKDLQVGSAASQSHNGHIVYSIDLMADDSGTTQIDGCVAGDTVWFKIGSIQAGTTAVWQSGMSVNLDLNGTAERAHGPAAWVNGYGPQAGGWVDQNTFPRMLGDVDGDGRDDIVAFGNRATYVSLSTGNEFAGAQTWIHAYGPAAGGWVNYDTYPRTVGDVNGDGLDDIVAFGHRATYVSLSTGTHFEPLVPWISGFGPAAGGWSSFDRYPRVLGDVDGDGKQDIVGFGEKGIFVSLSTGSGFGPITFWLNGFGRSATAGGWDSQNAFPRMTGDVNGDGRDDIVGFGGGATYVSLSTGTGFAEPTVWIVGFGVRRVAGGWTTFDEFPRVIADMDGDGRDDIVGFGGASVYVSMSTSSGFEEPIAWVSNYGAQAGGWTNYNSYPRVAGDLDADGRSDILGFGGRAAYVSLTSGGSLSVSALAGLAVSDESLDLGTAMVEIKGLPSGPEIDVGDIPDEQVEGYWIQQGDPEDALAGELPDQPELLPEGKVASPRDMRDSGRGAPVR